MLFLNVYVSNSSRTCAVCIYVYHIDTVLMDAVEAFGTQLAQQGTCATPITDDQIF